MTEESSWMVLHCCDNLCEYNLIRSFNSCGSKLCASMAATSIIFLWIDCQRISNVNKWWKCVNCVLTLTLQNLVLFDSKHSIRSSVAPYSDSHASSPHYWQQQLGCYLLGSVANMFVHLALIPARMKHFECKIILKNVLTDDNPRNVNATHVNALISLSFSKYCYE